MDNLVFPCAACLIIGFLGGFAFGFRTATMVRQAQKPLEQQQSNDELEEVAA